MIHVNPTQEDDRRKFAERAARWFNSHPEHWTFTDDAVEGGEWFAVCWGLDRNSVVTFRISVDAPPVNYEDLALMMVDYK